MAVENFTRLANIMRGLIFATVEAGQSGHPGGSSSKVEQFLAMILSGVVAFDPLNPKNPGRDRVVWSAGHCTPAIYSGLSIIYQSLRRGGRLAGDTVTHSVFSEQLSTFRQSGGLPGHAESLYPLVDVCTGSSGHGLSTAVGMAVTHKSCGLPTRVWVFMGDAESEEGITYEARNLAVSLGANNLIVSVDCNNFGIDGPITEIISSPYANHWKGMGWNVIEVDGHDVMALSQAYKTATESKNKPTAVLCHTIKGKDYGNRENTAMSHGMPIEREQYENILIKLGFDPKGTPTENIANIISALTDEDVKFVCSAMEASAHNIKPESELVNLMKSTLPQRPFCNPMSIGRPKKLPPELIFEGQTANLRKAVSAWATWLMKQTAFFFAGSADLSKSILTNSAEDVYGIISRDNPLGRGIRFGIAEANMAMFMSGLTEDVLPGGIKPISLFGTYAEFSSLMANSIRMSLVGNQINPANKGFFIALASHDGPETGEDGPTHQGLYWMSLFDAYPGIKVYKPADANETIEMLFYALEKGEPIVLSLPRPDWPLIERGKHLAPPAHEAINGAYILKHYNKKDSRKKIVLAVCGGKLVGDILGIVPDLEKKRELNVKIVCVTSPELFAEFRKKDPAKAKKILSDTERSRVITFHNGWTGFMDRFLLPADYEDRAMGVENFLQSCKPDQAYALAGLSAQEIKDKILGLIK